MVESGSLLKKGLGRWGKRTNKEGLESRQWLRMNILASVILFGPDLVSGGTIDCGEDSSADTILNESLHEDDTLGNTIPRLRPERGFKERSYLPGLPLEMPDWTTFVFSERVWFRLTKCLFGVPERFLKTALCFAWLSNWRNTSAYDEYSGGTCFLFKALPRFPRRVFLVFTILDRLQTVMQFLFTGHLGDTTSYAYLQNSSNNVSFITTLEIEPLNRSRNQYETFVSIEKEAWVLHTADWYVIWRKESVERCLLILLKQWFLLFFAPI